MRSVVRTIAMFSLVILGSCNQSGMGTFHSIRNEVAIQDTALENDITILSISVLTDAYYVVTGELRYRDSTITDPTLFEWAKRELPADTTLFTSSAVLSGDLYVTATDLMEQVEASVESSLFKLDESDGTWTLVDLGVGSANSRVLAVSAYSEGLLVTTSVDDYSYLGFVTTDGSTFDPLTLPFSTVAPRRVVKYAGDLWVIAGNALYTGSAFSLSAVSDANSPGSASPVETLLVDIRHYPDISALLVLAADGTLYAYTGSTWLSSGTDPDEVPGIEVLDESSSIQATRLFGAGVAGEQVILVGTESGYLEIVLPTAALDAAAFDAAVADEPGENAASTSGTDYSIVDLSSSAILDFEIDGTLLFVATSGAGLWRIDLAADLSWGRE